MSNEEGLPETFFYVCTGSKCKKKGGKVLAKKIQGLVKKDGLKRRVEVIKTSCTGRCNYAPNICVQPANKWFCMVKEDEIESIFQKFAKK